MNYGEFVGMTSGVSGLRALLSNYEGANVYMAESNHSGSCMVEVYYNAETNTITLA